MDGTGELFRPFLAASKPEFRATVIKYPTDKLLDYAALAESVSSQLPTDERFVLLAESFSGPIAISLAASKPKGLTDWFCARLLREIRDQRWVDWLLCLVCFISLACPQA